MMNLDVRHRIVDEMTEHFCYICHKGFSKTHNHPRVELIGQVGWRKTLYIRRFYAHIDCYMSKEVKRKQTILGLPHIRLTMGKFLKDNLKGLKKDYREIHDPVWRGLILADIKQYSKWLKELSGR